MSFVLQNDRVLVDLPASIETERLLMRPPQAGDGPQLHAAVEESLEDLRRFPGSVAWACTEQTLDSAERYCRCAQASFLTRQWLSFHLFERGSGKLVGNVSLHDIDWAVPKARIGYWGRTSRRGNGFISEATAALTRYAFTHCEAARVEIVVDEQNIASRLVAERCGFVLEGTLRHDRRAPDGTLRSSCIYAHCWIRHTGGFGQW